MSLPTEHPLRLQLFNESHTRPYAGMCAPVQASYLVLLTGEVSPVIECDHLRQLAERYSVAPPHEGATHYNVDFGPFSIKWEKHTEFSSYLFFSKKTCETPCTYKVIAEVPDEWLKAIKGELLVAQHIEIVPSNEQKLSQEAVSALFQEDSLVGSYVSQGAAEAWTDFRLQKDGFSQVLVFDKSLTPQTTSRLVQHLAELEAYRMLAMLGFPLVAEYGAEITAMGKRLTHITHRMSLSESTEEEQALLEDLTSLEANIERVIAATAYRFSATRAYQSITDDRVQRLLETRIEGRQKLSAYLGRRFHPAMKACDSTSIRLENLSRRIARASQIMMARTDLALKSQNRDLLDSMDKRAQLQMRLQETVEGLSIAAISYYIVSLMSYVAKAIKGAGIPISIDIFVGISIPVVLFSVWLAVRKIKKHITKSS